jgi:hypothetical protein
MERVRRIEHKGKSIILIDVTSCDAADVARVLVEGRKLIATCPPKSALTLTDVTGARFDDTASREAQNNARENAPFVHAGALVGVTGLKKIVYNVVTRATGRDFKVCESREQALEWLAGQP